MEITYRIAQLKDIEIIGELSSALHSPPYTLDEDLSCEECIEMHKDEFADDNYAFFLAFSGSDAVGFSYVSHRYEYVVGTDGDGETGCLEGIYVKPEYCKHGIAKELVYMCENWAKEKGCKEFASDCLIGNKDSLAFHLKIGFIETNRLIHFAKKL